MIWNQSKILLNVFSSFYFKHYIKGTSLKSWVAIETALLLNTTLKKALKK